MTELAKTPKAVASRSGPERGRPRSREAHKAVLEATLRLMATTSFSNLTLEAIAAESKVAKTTIYRWWPGKDELVTEALQVSLLEIEEPDTGSLRGDLSALLMQTGGIVGKSGLHLARLMAELAENPPMFRATRDSMIEPRRAVQRAVLQRAIDRGEIRADVDVDLAIELVIGAIQYRALYLGATPAKEDVERLVELAINGLGAERERSVR
jgi:AcrR family transcriptional regulator